MENSEPNERRAFIVYAKNADSVGPLNELLADGWKVESVHPNAHQAAAFWLVVARKD